MGLFDSIKNIMTIPDEEDYEEEEAEVTRSSRERDEEEYEAPRKERVEAPRIIKSRVLNTNKNQGADSMQVILVKPERFDDVTDIADHLNAGRTVVLNLEETNHDISRRIVDFLSGAAYANGGNMKKVARNTFIIVARGVDVAGELMLDEFDDSRTYY